MNDSLIIKIHSRKVKKKTFGHWYRVSARAQQVKDLLVVDLVVADLDVGCDLGLALLSLLEQSVKEAGYEAWTLTRANHGVGFSGAGLTVRKYGHIVTVECLY